ncbi:MAG: hypothetical protein JW856_02940, partial [Dehalococcoidales bacterium]|nr:hypothetical protein [Dehalococcoidales bacterium]
GADGFMFSVSETTLEVIRNIHCSGSNLRYYAIVPAAGDYVRLSSKFGMVGLVRYVAKQVINSRDFSAIANGAKGILFNDTKALFKAYIRYEISRINSKMNKGHRLYSLMLHELVTEMAMALNMDWLVRTHVQYLSRLGIKPGFETRNFQYLVKKLRSWGIDTKNIVITAPFNKIGYQMNPSRIDCEQVLESVPQAEIIAMSVLGSGRVKLDEAKNYLNHLPNLHGAVIGVSSEKQAEETFEFFGRK